MPKLTSKSKLKSGDMVINNNTGTIILLLERVLIPTHNFSTTNNVAFWNIFVTKNRIAEYYGITSGLNQMKEKNIRYKIEDGTLSLIKKIEKENK